MNTNAKIRNFAWGAAAVAVVLLVAGVAQNWQTSSEIMQPSRDVQAESAYAAEAWEASSFRPESRLVSTPSLKLSPVPPLPDENEKIEFKLLPPTVGREPCRDLQPKENEAFAVSDRSAVQFSPLPHLDKIKTHVPAEIPTATADKKYLASQASSNAVEGQEGSNSEGQVRQKSAPQNGFRFKNLPAPASGDQTKAIQSATTLPAIAELGFINRLPKPDRFFRPASTLEKAASPYSPWEHPQENGGVQLVIAQVDLSGPNEAGTTLKIPVDVEPVDVEPIDVEPIDDQTIDDQPQLGESLPEEKPVAEVARLPKLPADKKKKKKVVVAAKKGSSPKSATGKKAGSKDEFTLAAQPELGAHYIEDKPQTDQYAHLIEPLAGDFSPDATNPMLPYEPHSQMNVYQGKTLNANQRPLVELGRPWYQLGQLSPGSSVLGFHNNVTPQFLIFGDHRTAYASNRQNGNSTSQIATQLNLDFDLKLTGTERFHAFVQPLSSGGRNTRRLLDDDEMIFEGSANPAFGYFEGDLGALVGGATNKTLPFDLPFTAGIIPLVFQNGVWFEDAILGVAATLPAKNSPRFNISNMDITFFAGYDKVDSPAFQGDDSAARIMGIASFLEMLNGYFEIDYAFLDDRTFADRSYHNIGVGYTRRYGRFVSNSTRVIVNAGQNSSVVGNTADGVLLLSENSLITGFPSNVVPYFNFFAGFDRPQSAARAGIAGGVLRNTGILFESDNLTGYPTLDATANDTFGMSLGVEVLSGGDRFSQQLVVETSMLGVMGDAATRNAAGDQYGVGFRYQLPLSNSVIFRADGMMGFLRNDDDISGIRMEIRKKF